MFFVAFWAKAKQMHYVLKAKQVPICLLFFSPVFCFKAGPAAVAGRPAGDHLKQNVCFFYVRLTQKSVLCLFFCFFASKQKRALCLFFALSGRQWPNGGWWPAGGRPAAGWRPAGWQPAGDHLEQKVHTARVFLFFSF